MQLLDESCQLVLVLGVAGWTAQCAEDECGRLQVIARDASAPFDGSACLRRMRDRRRERWSTSQSWRARHLTSEA